MYSFEQLGGEKVDYLFINRTTQKVNISQLECIIHYDDKHFRDKIGLSQAIEKFRSEKNLRSAFDVIEYTSHPIILRVHVEFLPIFFARVCGLTKGLYSFGKTDTFKRLELREPMCTFPKKFPLTMQEEIKKFMPYFSVEKVYVLDLRPLKKLFKTLEKEMKKRPCGLYYILQGIPFEINCQLLRVSDNPVIAKAMHFMLEAPHIGKYHEQGYDKEPIFGPSQVDWRSSASKKEFELIERERWSGATNVFELMLVKEPLNNRTHMEIEDEFHASCTEWAEKVGLKYKDKDFFYPKPWLNYCKQFQLGNLDSYKKIEV